MKFWSLKLVKGGNWFGDFCIKVLSRVSKVRDMYYNCFEKENYVDMCNGNLKGDIWFC